MRGSLVGSYMCYTALTRPNKVETAVCRSHWWASIMFDFSWYTIAMLSDPGGIMLNKVALFPGHGMKELV